MEHPRLFLITGIMAAGKSSVAQALAERFPASVHVRGDTFRKFVVNGYAAMTPDASPQALEHLRLRYRLAASAADAYVEAGFVTVLQDVILGAELPGFLAMLRTRPLALVVLAPSADEVARREAARNKTAYTAFTPRAMDAGMRESTEPLGLWLDTSTLTVEETVDGILGNIGTSLIR